MATTTYYTDIQKLYVAYFNRPADAAGLQYWATIVDGTKGDTTLISSAFASSAEYKATFAGMGPSAVVTQIYQNLFNRAPEPAGLNFWSSNLAAGKITIDSVVKNIADGAQGTDKTSFDNKVKAAVQFTNQLDTPAEVASYAKPASSATAKAFISSITTDASLASALVPATLAATVANVVTAGNSGSGFSMATTVDTLVGTDGNDAFTARIFNNANSLQSGDRIDGGAGAADRLDADVGNSQAFAITAESVGLEIAAFRAQTITTTNDQPDNNMASLREVQIDAQRMFGVNQWESNNSRADLIIEDVRILDGQITKDITIAMVETDPGHVDFAVYFDQYSLRARANETNTLSLQVIDTRSAAANLDPLKESPYFGFQFYYRGVVTKVTSQGINDAQNYDVLVSEINKQLKLQGLTNIEATKGGNFTVLDTEGKPVTGSEVFLKSVTVGDTITSDGPLAGWLADGPVPPSSGLHTKMGAATSRGGDLVTSKIILDDVGRGSTGGDLVIGGLSVGDTSTSKGVQAFEIEVRDNSKLQTIASTNNTLQEVTIRTGVTTSIPKISPYYEIEKDKGNLTVLGNDFGTSVINAALPGTQVNGNQHSTFGFSDVRILNATDFNGKFVFDAEITGLSINKYINLTDTGVTPSDDNIAFVYTGGNNDDTMTVQIDGNVLGSRSLLMAGREDFTFTANGGLGNDNITLSIVDGQGANNGGFQNWYNNQVINGNVTINAGEGNDTVRKPGAGNVTINTAGGDDTIYTENTGVMAPAAARTVNDSRATYVFNAIDGDAGSAGSQYLFSDLRSQAFASVSAVNAQVMVNYRGLTKTVTIANSLNSQTNVTINDLQINQAIKEAINADPVLNKLLIAQDGPSRTLIVRSLTDGLHTTADLVISFPVLALNASQAAITPVLNNFGSASGFGAISDGYLTTNFAQYDALGAAPQAGVVGVAGVSEVQTIDFAVESVAAGQTLTFAINGVNFVYTNATAAALAGAALVAAIVATPPVNAAGGVYTFTAPAASTTLTVTQGAANQSNIAAITVLNQTPDAAAPLSTTVTDGVTPVTAVAAIAAASQVTGADSLAVSDNTTTAGSGNDVIVLGTLIGVDGLNSSNEKVAYAGVFGNDTIVNFDITGNAVDYLDFTALGGVGSAFANTITTTAKSINVVAETLLNDTVAEITALYLAADSAGQTAATTHVFVAYDTNNLAKVYTVIDGVGNAAGNIVVTPVGTIDLADSAWSTVTGANFI